MNVIRLVGDHSHQSAKLGDFTAIIPYPDLPEGWEHTNEYRVPRDGEYWVDCGRDAPVVAQQFAGTFTAAAWIVRKKVEYCPACGQKKG